MPNHPYRNLPDSAFWKRAVATRHYEDINSLWTPPRLNGTEKFATAGSCFAQHIGRHISARGSNNYMEMETPPLFLPEEEHSRYGYGIYSCRYGNIYTSRQLLQLAQESLSRRSLSTHVWEKEGRYYDALRPTVDPIGHETAQQVIDLRKRHLDKVASMLRNLDVMVFTLGLTETWIAESDGTAYPTAPGVVAGDYSPRDTRFVNLSIDDVRNDLASFWKLLTDVNPGAQMILTVSPVPLIATASMQHVLSATTYSKAVLRVAAQDLANYHDRIHYFPSYEIVNSPQGRGYYFDPDLRSVNQRGVEYVMSHFFSGDLARIFPKPSNLVANDLDVVCDEELVERRNEGSRIR